MESQKRRNPTELKKTVEILESWLSPLVPGADGVPIQPHMAGYQIANVKVRTTYYDPRNDKQPLYTRDSMVYTLVSGKRGKDFRVCGDVTFNVFKHLRKVFGKNVNQ